MLTPPDTASEEDDGLLTASEVAQLKLDADWVLLSACNTASAGKLGGDALSGLARAFFYAGSRALLVSHWYVSSDAALKLTTKALAELAVNSKVGRSEALRRSMTGLWTKGQMSRRTLRSGPRLLWSGKEHQEADERCVTLFVSFSFLQ